ncbi:PilZ domain-containing protein, partial [Thermodesulfobacteriota bacterium]
VGRRHLRYEVKVEATILTADIKFKTNMIDISEGGIGVILEKAIKYGTKVKVLISLEPKNNYVFHGTVIWSSHIHDDGENYYKMGIKIDRIILEDIEDIKAISFPEKSELVAQILSQIKNQQMRVVKKYSL